MSKRLSKLPKGAVESFHVAPNYTTRPSNSLLSNQVKLLDVKHLRHFAVVVELENVSRAAELLNITQPALTQSLKNLEASLNTMLLTRKSRGVETTEAGRRLYSYAQRILNECENAFHEIRKITDGQIGHVHIGTAKFFCDDLMARIVVALSEKHPGLSMKITEGKFLDLIKRMSNGELDIILSNYSVFSDKVDFDFEPLVKIKSRLLVGSTHPLANVKNVAKKNLKSFRLAIPHFPQEGDFLNRVYGDLGFRVSDAVVSNSMSLLRSLVISGRFVTLLPQHLLAKEIEAGSVQALDLPGMPLTREGGIVLRPLPAQRHQVELVADVIRQECAGWSGAAGL